MRKFVCDVEQVTYSGRHARQQRQAALYVTERAVFSLEPEGLVLREIAPGIDLRRDVLDQMDFQPIVSGELRQMDPSCFDQPFGEASS